MVNDKMKQFETFWRDLIHSLRLVKTNAGEGIFNQYASFDRGVDVPNAASIRTENLENYLKSIGTAPVLIVGEAPSHRGTRFSGVPLFGEKQIIEILNGRQSSNVNKPFCSATDTIFWGVMLKYYCERKFLCWNVFPLHPHRPGKTMTNRTPKNEEIKRFKHVLELIMRHFKPSYIIAVGRKAEKQINVLDENLKYEYVRHPAKGGKSEFAAKMKRLFESL